MKVIGKQVKTYRVVCPHCSSVLTFTDDDIEQGFIPYFDKVKCPVCEHKSYFSNKEKFIYSAYIE